MIHRKLRPILVWAVLLAISFGVEIMLHKPREILLQLLPTSIFSLNRDFALGLAITFVASLLAWLVAIFGGFTLGIGVASTMLKERRHHELISLGTNLDMAIRAFYIIPFVLTVTLFHALISAFVAKYDLPQWILAAGLIAVSGMALGGYQIYRSVFESVSKAKTESRILIETLFYRSEKSRTSWQRFSQVRRLHDCEIQGFWSALELAAHLSIVSVMIVEAVIPQFYETVFPSYGPVSASLGGAGRLILSSTQLTAFQQVAGCIWIVLLFDFLLTAGIDAFSHRRWRRYYGA